MTDPEHAGNRLFAGLREGLPLHISDERVAFAAQRAHEAGINDMSKVGRVIEREGDVFVVGTTPGFRASVLAGEQPPPSNIPVQRLPSKLLCNLQWSPRLRA